MIGISWPWRYRKGSERWGNWACWLNCSDKSENLPSDDQASYCDHRSSMGSHWHSALTTVVMFELYSSLPVYIEVYLLLHTFTAYLTGPPHDAMCMLRVNAFFCTKWRDNPTHIRTLQTPAITASLTASFVPSCNFSSKSSALQRLSRVTEYVAILI